MFTQITLSKSERFFITLPVSLFLLARAKGNEYQLKVSKEVVTPDIPKK